MLSPLPPTPTLSHLSLENAERFPQPPPRDGTGVWKLPTYGRVLPLPLHRTLPQALEIPSPNPPPPRDSHSSPTLDDDETGGRRKGDGVGTLLKKREKREKSLRAPNDGDLGPCSGPAQEA
jgi:hypothetical protein